MTQPVRVLVVDDHLVVREGLRLILDAEPSMQSVGEASCGEEALALIDELEPDVVLLDVRLPGMGGLETLRRLRRLHPRVGVVILTTFDEPAAIRQAARAGAHGYLLKDVERDELFAVIRAAHRGETMRLPEPLQRAMASPDAVSHAAELTPREQEISSALIEGLRSKEIARDLGISERTVKAHLTRLYMKLGVETRASAVAEVIRRGLAG